jgi:hypothetical protein
MGAVRRQMLTKAIAYAKTNFFIQCSWVKRKSRTIFNHSLSESATGLAGGGLGDGKRYHSFPCSVGWIIESPRASWQEKFAGTRK